MEGKKVKIEISRIGLIFVILFGLCLIVWSFIIGVWVGSKIGPKEEQKIALESPPSQVSPPSSVSSYVPIQNETSQNQTAYLPKENHTITNKTLGNYTLNQTKELPKPVSSLTSPRKLEEKVEPPKTKEKPSTPVFKQKEVAKISSEIKKEEKKEEKYYALQIGAFSNKESAENLKILAEKKGYKAFVKPVNLENKTLYKVYVGKYLNRAEAEKHISKITSDLGISNPFVVELK